MYKNRVSVSVWWLWMFSHKFEHPKSTPYFCRLLIWFISGNLPETLNHSTFLIPLISHPKLAQIILPESLQFSLGLAKGSSKFIRGKLEDQSKTKFWKQIIPSPNIKHSSNKTLVACNGSVNTKTPAGSVTGVRKWSKLLRRHSEEPVFAFKTS